MRVRRANKANMTNKITENSRLKVPTIKGPGMVLLSNESGSKQMITR